MDLRCLSVFKVILLQEYSEGLPVAGQGVLEESLAFLQQNNRFVTTAVVLVAFGSTHWEEPARYLFQLVPLCSHFATNMFKKH